MTTFAAIDIGSNSCRLKIAKVVAQPRRQSVRMGRSTQRIQLVGKKLPHIPLIACFETDFHQTIPVRNRYYAVPFSWAEDWLIQRWGFHGAILIRSTAVPMPRATPKRIVISTHSVVLMPRS